MHLYETKTARAEWEHVNDTTYAASNARQFKLHYGRLNRQKASFRKQAELQYNISQQCTMLSPQAQQPV